MKGKAKELLNDIEDCFPMKPSFFIHRKIEDLIEEYAEVYNLCPECLGELTEKEYKEYRGEELGIKEYEVFYYKQCPECGWEE